ncbi:MAG: amino acid adenylation domain-containing protein [Gammaproteobacteria bacterium]
MDSVMDGYRISPQQSRIWRLQGTPARGRFRAHCTIVIDGDFDADRFEAAAARVVARHELLRTRLVLLPAMTMPAQVIGDAGRMSLEWIAPQIEATEGLQSALAAIAAAHDSRPFDPADGASTIAAIARMGTQRHALVLSCPALWADTLGLRNLAAVLARACDAAGDDTEPLQYADLAQWQCELLDEPVSEVGRDYWRRLDPDTAARVRLPMQTTATGTAFAPNRRVMQIPAASETLARVARIASITPRALLLAAWQATLHRMTGAGGLVLGYTCDGRSYEELRDALGPVARDVPVTSEFEPDLRFTDFAHQADATVTAAERWQECFAWTDAPEGADPTARYLPAGFEFRHPPPALVAGGMRWTIVDESCCHDRFSLKLLAAPAGADLVVEILYDTAAFDDAAAGCYAESFQALLLDAMARPEAKLCELRLADDAQLARAAASLRPAPVPPPPALLHEMVALHARATPSATAVADDAGEVSYGDLELRAGRLATRLRRVGVGPEVRVALCMERGSGLIVGMLGILKAGGAYVPIDPALPAARQRYIADDCGANVVVTRGGAGAAIAAGGRSVIDVDAGGEGEGEGEEASDAAVVAGDNAAYVLYTSGSTGTPKGVVVEHRQVRNYVHGLLERLGLHEPTSFALVSTFGADLGNTAVYGALATGGTLHVISQDAAADAETLAEYFDRHPVDGLKIVPSHLSGLLASPAGARVLPRRLLILGGETLRWPLVDAVLALAPECAIFNHYGPTEATIGCACGRVDPDAPRAETVPIGAPLANVELAIVDTRGNPVPAGVAGELLIGGSGVARGYLNRPELTAERFAAAPAAGLAGRAYRSGDLTRLLPGGRIEFVARADAQIKIRGFRVEPAEIEAVLRQHPSVRDAVVMGHNPGADDARLTGFVAAGPPAPPVEELRALLADRLPEYMVPSSVMVLDALPLTVNGKVDRLALAVLAERPVASSADPALAGTEAVIAELWRALLPVTDVRAGDNFFDLGGNSMLALQVVGRLRKATGVRITPRELLLQSLGQLARLVDERRAAMQPGQSVRGEETGDRCT